jgi:hypothetical protein
MTNVIEQPERALVWLRTGVPPARLAPPRHHCVEVFDRGADFDPNVNPIVRIEAGRLRTRLLAHYGGEGARDPMRIEMPKGGYAVRFLQRGGPALRIDPQDGLRMGSNTGDIS